MGLVLVELGAQMCETPAFLWGLQPAYQERRVGKWGGVLRCGGLMAHPAQITGTWYVKAVVADKGLFKEKRPKAVSPVTLDLLDGGYLEASFTFL